MISRIVFGLVSAFWYCQLWALPVYSDQTEEKCSACHIHVGELTPRGRKFKLLGYTQGKSTTLFAALGSVSLTKIKDTNSSLSPEVTMPQNGSIIPEGGSALITGKFADDVGGKIKLTANTANTTPLYGTSGVQTGTKVGSDFFLDASEVRAIKRGNLFGNEMIYGLSLNNAPAQEDLWITTPINSFPYKSSQLINAWGLGQFGPTSLIDGGLSSQTKGISFYGLLDEQWYFAIGNYWKFSSNSSLISASGTPTTINSTSNPYFRVARNQVHGDNSWMYGLFGMKTSLARDPAVAGSASGTYKDLGVDAEYQHITDTHTWSTQVVLIHETNEWGARSVGRSHDTSRDTLTTLKAKVSYNYARTYTGSLFGFKSRGSHDDLYWSYNQDPLVVTGACNQTNSSLAFCSQNGKPDTSGFGYELMYNPQPRWTIGLQQVFYKQFLGGSSFIDNSSGNVRQAKDNNLTYLYVLYAY